MELQRSIQRAGWFSKYSVVTTFLLFGVTTITISGCHANTKVVNNNRPNQDERIVVLIADNLELDGTTVILHNPTLPPSQAGQRLGNNAQLASKWALVTSDATLASRISIAFPAELTPDNTLSADNKALLLTMMPPLTLGAPTELEVVKYSANAQIEKTKRATIDVLSCVSSESQRSGETSRR